MGRFKGEAVNYVRAGHGSRLKLSKSGDYSVGRCRRTGYNIYTNIYMYIYIYCTDITLRTCCRYVEYGTMTECEVVDIGLKRDVLAATLLSLSTHVRVYHR